MPSAKLLFLLGLVVVFSCFNVEGIWRRLPVKKPLPHFPKHPSKRLPLCKPKEDVKAILSKGGHGTSTRRTKRGVSWPYECRYASIIKYQGSYQFMMPIYECCVKCKDPEFKTCTQTNPSPYWLCPTGGIHCIVNCVKKNDPNNPIGQGTGVGIVQPKVTIGIHKITALGKVTPGNKKVKKFKCTKIDVVNGKKCIRQLCIPLRKI